MTPRQSRLAVLPGSVRLLLPSDTAPLAGTSFAVSVFDGECTPRSAMRMRAARVLITAQHGTHTVGGITMRRGGSTVLDAEECAEGAARAVSFKSQRALCTYPNPNPDPTPESSATHLGELLGGLGVLLGDRQLGQLALQLLHLRAPLRRLHPAVSTLYLKGVTVGAKLLGSTGVYCRPYWVLGGGTSLPIK